MRRKKEERNGRNGRRIGPKRASVPLRPLSTPVITARGDSKENYIEVGLFDCNSGGGGDFEQRGKTLKNAIIAQTNV